MAASESREGPGWWMDSEGGWNPPETWPEATPPLPGWVRNANGEWLAPDSVTPAPVVDAATLNLVINKSLSANGTSANGATANGARTNGTAAREDAEITRTPKNGSSLRQEKKSFSRNSTPDQTRGADRVGLGSKTTFGNKSGKKYAPAHAASLVGYQGPTNEPDPIDRSEPTNVQLGYAKTVVAPPVFDEDIIPRWVRITVNVVAGTIAALIAGLLVALLLL